MQSYRLQYHKIVKTILLFTLLCNDSLLAYEADPAPSATEDPKAEKPTFYIKEIVIEGATSLSKKNKQRLLAPYINSYLDVDKINKLVQDIKIFYIRKGYPTTQVKVVIGQSLQSGTLRLVVVNGFIEKIRLNKDTPRDKGRILTAFPLLSGKPLYLKHLEQGIDQLNALASSSATLKILPGKLEGGSIIQIENIVTNPLRVDIGGDNLGEAETGRWRGKVNLALDNLLSINDNITLHYATNKAKKIRDKKLSNKSFLVSFTFPLGYYIFSTTYNLASSITPAKSHSYTSLYFNKNNSNSFDVKRVIYKTRTHKISLGVGLALKRTAAFLEDTPIGNQTRKLSVGKGNLNHTGLLFRGQYVLDISYFQGLSWWGAKKDAQPTQAGQAKAQFKKLNLHLLWMRPFLLLKQYFSYQLNLSAQYSKDALFGSEQFSIAGLEQVRGVQQQHVGNQGLCFKQEIALHNLLSFSPMLIPFQPLVGLDIGYLPQVSSMDPKFGNKPGTLVSWACGCKYGGSWLSFDFTYAKPIYRSEHLKKGNAFQVYFNLSFRLHHMLRSVLSKK